MRNTDINIIATIAKAVNNLDALAEDESMTQRDNAPIQAVRVDIYGQTHRRRTYWVYLTPDGKAFLDAIDAYTHAYNCVQQSCKRIGCEP